MTTRNVSDNGIGVQSNITHWPDITSFAEYQTAMYLWKLYSPCILLLGGFGNIATIVVMRRVLDDSSSQHVFLIALAVSDLTLLYTGLLREWVRHLFSVDVRLWHLATCKLQKWLLYSTNTTSAWLVTSVTVQRTMAVLWPHRVRVVCTVRRTWVVAGGVVLVAFLLHFHLVLGMHMVGENRCDYTPGVYGYFFTRVFTWLDMCLSSLFPSVCQVVCDVILSVTLFRAGSSILISPHASSSANPSTVTVHDSRKKTASRTTVMILALSFTFLALTMPASLFIVWLNLVYDDVIKSVRGPALIELMVAVTYLLWYSNSAVNFLLYCMTGTRFRTAFLSLFCGDGHPSAASGTKAESSQRGRNLQ